MRYLQAYSQFLNEKKPAGAPDWHESDAPDAEGRFKELSPKKLAAWLIKTRNKDLRKITGSLNQQIVFNRSEDPEYADKIEKTRQEVYKQLGREDLMDNKQTHINMKYIKPLNEAPVFGNQNNQGYSDEMSYGQLERCMDYAKMIRERIEAGQSLDPWMHSQIAVAENELNSVFDALDGDDGVVESERDWNDKRRGPHPYTATLSDEDEKKKEAQMKKQAEMDDDDPEAYKEMPGSEEAREAGKVKTSKHVKSYHELYGDEETNESVDTYDIDNAKRRLENVYQHLGVEYGKTRRGDKYVMIKYIPVSRPQSQQPEWVKVFYDNDGDLKKISKELGMDLKESVINEAKVEVERYVRSHGKKPKGWGRWLFSYNRDGSEMFEIPTAMNWRDAQKWSKSKAKEDGKDYVYVMEAEEIIEGVMSNLHQLAGKVKDEAEFVKQFFKEYGDKVKKTPDSIEWVKSLYQDTVNEAKLKISGHPYNIWNDRDVQKELRNIKFKIDGDYNGVMTLRGDESELEKIKDLFGIKESLNEETELGYALRRLADVGGSEADNFLSNNKVSIDKIKRALYTNKFTKYDLRDVIQGKAATSIEKKVMRLISESITEAYSRITATGVSSSELKFLKTLSPDVQRQGPGVYIAVNDDNRKKVLDYLKKIKAEISESLNEEKAEGDRGPIDDEKIETALKKKEEETGVPMQFLRIIMRRGMAAWKTGHRPGATQQQWGYSRLNSFLTKQPGTWGGADADVAKEVRDGGHDKKLKKA